MKIFIDDDIAYLLISAGMAKIISKYFEESVKQNDFMKQ